MNRSYFVYILQSEKNGKFYIGSTKNIENRLAKHNRGHSFSTKAGRPWRVVYFETYENRTIALRREYEIKAKKSKVFLESLIIEDLSGE